MVNSASGFGTGQLPDKAVSYTHLDVYKRQAQVNKTLPGKLIISSPVNQYYYLINIVIMKSFYVNLIIVK